MGTNRIITQAELIVLQSIENELAAARRKVKRLLEEHENKEAPIMAALLKDAATVEPGRLTVSVDWSSRRSPDYKVWIDQHHGEGTAAKILEQTPPAKTPYLVIEPRQAALGGK